ncbi:MAG: DinB family protein [Candidatus Promineifilaceae bacterium]|nr:DinB family protein [Candidatus Promineifilaceae bacterium]
MDAYDMQDQLDSVRMRLLQALAPLPDEALLQSGVVGEWSIADVLSHFINWEAELITGLMRIDQGKRPARLLQALEDRDAYNAKRVEEMKGRDLDRIFDDLRQVRQQLEGWLEEFSRSDLESTNRYKGLGGRPLWKLIASASFEHEAEHLDEIETFSERWLDEENDGSISLTDIEVKENGHRQ